MNLYNFIGNMFMMLFKLGEHNENKEEIIVR